LLDAVLKPPVQPERKPFSKANFHRIPYFYMFRKQRLYRFIAAFLLLNLMQQIIAPAVSYALTSGYAQPEFTSYEGPGTTDMVNLATGDFTYSLPILDVPGPEGSFSLPLSYHAGIGLEQQASWTGLGWNINPGSIARSLNQFPDDANGEAMQTVVNYDGNRGWRTGGLGIVPMGWDSEKGHYGKVDLLGLASVSWENGLKGGSYMGYTLENGKLGFSVQKAVTSALTVASIAASGGTSLGVKLAINAGTTMAVSGAFSLARGNQSYSGFNKPTYKEENKVFYTNYWNFLRKNTTENMYGSLYFHNILPQNSSEQSQFVLQARKGTGSYLPQQVSPSSYSYPNSTHTISESISDVFTPIEGSEYYTGTNKPIHISHDYFSVMGGGVSGSIKPYRLETGSVSIRRMARRHDNYQINPYLNYKVGFRYEGGISNYYDYHKGNVPGGTPYDLGVNSDWTASNIQISDRTLYEQVTENETGRKGLLNKKVIQGKNIEWYSNAEIAAAYPNSPMDQGKFLEFAAPMPGSGTRNSFRAINKPQAGIGGFVVTSEDGTTYHYALPVYNYKQFSCTFQSTNINNKSTQKQANAFATSWLLTAVVGPDFVDRAPLGTLGPEDWGSWVKLDYGKFASNYKWRTPYAGYSYNSTDTGLQSPFYSEGVKETYYLNSISTRTHTALFIKDIRHDGKGHYTLSQTQNANLDNFNEQYPSSSLGLSEIILLDNKDYQTLATAGAVGAGVPAFTVNTNANATSNDAGILKNGDTFSRVWDVYDVAAHPSIRSFINQKAIKRVKFTYTYELCKKTVNSFANTTSPPSITTHALNDGVFANNYNNRHGKLTLRAISMYGSNNVKVAPDYIFEYGNNPDYDRNKWDEFGLFSYSGTSNVASHKVPSTTDGNAWSLKKIISPLGNSTEIVYERDSYSSVSGLNLENPRILTDNGNCRFTGNSIGTYYTSGDKITINYQITDSYQENVYLDDCGSGGGCSQTHQWSEVSSHTGTYTVASATTNEIILTSCPSFGDYPLDNYHIGREYKVTVGIPETITGGNLRVSALIVSDAQMNTYKTRYMYDSGPGGRSSGVIGKSPDYYSTYNVISSPYKQVYKAIESLEDLPETPVMYSKVTVLEGRLSTASDFLSKTEYEFVTPNVSMIKETTNAQLKTKQLAIGRDYLHLINNKIEINTAQIGQVKAVRQYNGRSQLTSETLFEYATQVPGAANPQQGMYTEGVVAAEFINELPKTGFFSSMSSKLGMSHYRINRTFKQFNPSVLVARRVRTGTSQAEQKYQKFDFYTGQVLQSEYKDALGNTFRAVTVPAYEKYAQMGPAGVAPGNKNMLAQSTASYVYKVMGGQLYPVAASVQTWKSDWDNYRVFNTTANRYEGQSEGPPVWRASSSSVWDGRQLNADGTLAGFVDYNWSGPSDPKWVKTGEMLRYDHYSMPLSSMDMNKNYASQKLDGTGRFVLSSTAGARYTEMAYSGAEDKVAIGNQFHFGGEVLAAEKQDATYKHTGNYSVKLAGGESGFTYQALIGDDQQLTTQVGSARAYRLSGWIHQTDFAAKAGKVYARIGNNIVAEAGLENAAIERAGDWYLVNLIFTIPTTSNGQLLTVGCRNAGSGMVWFDDFRFHPLDAPMVSYVYDNRGQLTYVLDNDNLYTRYQYDDTGMLTRSFQERLGATGNEQLISEKTIHYARPK